MHKASFMTVIANTLVGWLRLTVSMLLLFSGLFIILCFSTLLATLIFMNQLHYFLIDQVSRFAFLLAPAEIGWIA